MTSEGKLYWLAVGMAAVLLLNSASTIHRGWFESLQDRSLNVADRVVSRAFTSLNSMEGRLHVERSMRAEMVASRMDTRMACMQAAMARRQAEYARLQVGRAELESLRELNLSGLPQAQDFRIVVPRPPVTRRDGSL